MKKIFFIFFLLVSNISFSKSPSLPRNLLGVTFSPEYSYRFLSGSDTYSWLIDLRNEIENPKFGNTIGFKYSYRILNKFFIEGGALYSSKGYDTKKLDLIYNDPEPNAPVSLYKRYSYSFLEIPVCANYQLFDSCGFFISLGFIGNFPTRERVSTFFQYADGSETHDVSSGRSTTTNIFLSGIGGIGYFFRLSDKFYLKTEPFFKCSITPSASDNVKDYFYSYGLEVGVYFGK